MGLSKECGYFVPHPQPRSMESESLGEGPGMPPEVLSAAGAPRGCRGLEGQVTCAQSSDGEGLLLALSPCFSFLK